MRKVAFVLAILTFGYKGQCQDPDLTNIMWYLQEVIIDGQSHTTPVNSEVNGVFAIFGPVGFATSMCNDLGGPIQYTGQSFSFPSPLEFTFLDCNLQVNVDFERLYFDFYLDNQTEVFDYNIVNGSGDAKTLTVTAINGDVAIYGNELLSTVDNKKVFFSIYPNPVVERLFIQMDLPGKFEVSIFDIHGRKIISAMDSKELNLQSLTSGVYFIQINEDSGKTGVKKLIKL